jgi:hypothetical protein
MCAVVAQPHPKWDERPVAVLTLDGDGSADEVSVCFVCCVHEAPL